MELCSMLCNTLDGRGVWGRKGICICLAESLCCSPETITVLIGYVYVLVAQSCPTFCDPMNCNPPGSSVPGVLQARILEWLAIPFFRRSSQPRNRTQVSCNAGEFFASWSTILRIFMVHICIVLFCLLDYLSPWRGDCNKLRAIVCFYCLFHHLQIALSSSGCGIGS